MKRKLKDKSMLDVIGYKLKSIRLSRNITQQQVADSIGVDRTTYVKYETGACEMSYSTLMKIAKLFNASYDEILCYDLIDLFYKG